MQRIRQESNRNFFEIKKKLKENDNNLCFENLLYYQKIFKDILFLHVVAQYSNSKKACEVRINFKEVKDLIDRMT